VALFVELEVVDVFDDVGVGLTKTVIVTTVALSFELETVDVFSDVGFGLTDTVFVTTVALFSPGHRRQCMSSLR
jgi:hypothetical protein